MSLPAKKHEAVAGVRAFLLDDGDKFEWQEGQRRELPKVAGLPFRWPKTFKEQKDYFETWHALAMKVIADSAPASGPSLSYGASLTTIPAPCGRPMPPSQLSRAVPRRAFRAT